MSVFTRLEPDTLPHQLSGVFKIPGCKSISHRVFLLSLALGVESRISNFNIGEDVCCTRKAVQQLGCDIRVLVDGTILSTPGEEDAEQETNLSTPDEEDVAQETNTPIEIDCGNSGTAVRLLMGLCAGLEGVHVTLTGDESLLKRPMQRVAEPLRQMGADITLTNDLFLPAHIRGQKLKAIHYALPVPSAQVKSAILLAALHAIGQTVIEEPFESRDHTENLLQYFGVDLQKEGQHIILNPAEDYAKLFQIPNTVLTEVPNLCVPGDASAAAIWAVAASVIPGSKITIENVNANPRRLVWVDVLKKMGACIEVIPQRSLCGEEACTLVVTATHLSGIVCEEDLRVGLIDEYPILSVAAALAKGESVFKGLGELKLKESNRVDRIMHMLQAFGVDVELGDDTIVIKGCDGKLPTMAVMPKVETHADHRIAMSAIVLAMCAKSGIELTDINAIDTSDPYFRKNLCLS